MPKGRRSHLLLLDWMIFKRDILLVTKSLKTLVSTLTAVNSFIRECYLHVYATRNWKKSKYQKERRPQGKCSLKNYTHTLSQQEQSHIPTVETGFAVRFQAHIRHLNQEHKLLKHHVSQWWRGYTNNDADESCINWDNTGRILCELTSTYCVINTCQLLLLWPILLHSIPRKVKEIFFKNTGLNKEIMWPAVWVSNF